MKWKWVLSLLAVVLAVGLYAGSVLATNPAGLSTTILAKSTVDRLNLTGHAITSVVGKDGKTRPGLWLALVQTLGQSDLYVVDNKITPGGTTGWHSHPGPSIIFVISGSVTNYDSSDPNCAPQVYTAGQAFVDSGGTDVHTLRNEDPSVTAETIAVQFLPQGAARKTDEAEPSNCHI